MRFTLFALLGLSLVACRDNGGDDDDTPNPDAPPGGDFVTIQQIQDDAMAVGTAVKLQNVVVSGIDEFGARTGDLWVQDPAGGPFSGIKVFGAPLDVVAGLQVGDVVTITNAEKDEFALMEDMSGNKVTEIKGAAGGAMAIQKTGTMTLTPTTVDALAIEMLPTPAERDAEWEKWEGVLITATNIRQLTAVGPFGGGAEDQQAFDATGGIEVQSLLTSLGANALVDTCYQGITGIGDYFFSYKLLPRDESELVTGGTGCSAQQLATIEEVQTGVKTGVVAIDNVFVVAVSFNKKNLWVSHSLTAAPNEGIFIFKGGNQDLPAEIVPGAKVNIRGRVKEHNNDAMGDTVTQIEGNPTIIFLEAPNGTVAPVTNQTAATLTVAATGEPFESVLVTLTNVKVTAVGNQQNFGVGQMQQGATTFVTDDDVIRLLPAELDKCYASVTGIWSYSVFENAYSFLPLAAGTGTGTCP